MERKEKAKKRWIGFGNYNKILVQVWRMSRHMIYRESHRGGNRRNPSEDMGKGMDVSKIRRMRRYEKSLEEV